MIDAHFETDTKITLNIFWSRALCFQNREKCPSCFV